MPSHRPPESVLPRAPGLDLTVALWREGYRFIPSRCDALGTDGFRTRLMLRPAICLRGPEAVALLYAPDSTTRVGAMPDTTLRLLQDKGSVQQLEGDAHRARKAVFLDLLTEPERVSDLVARFREAWREALPRWQAAGRIRLMEEMNLVLARAALGWCGLEVDRRDLGHIAHALFVMSDRSGHFGPATVSALLRRNEVERLIAARIADIRAGTVAAPPGSPLAVLTGPIETGGALLPLEVATVEVLNLLRPIVAVGRWITFAAHALHVYPEWHMAFREGFCDMVEPFCEEVRRLYPFFPMVGAVATRDLEWNGIALPEGSWLLVDLYGTMHDPRSFAGPDRFRPERLLSHRDEAPSFVPQGGGRPATSHRCPGEAVTVSLLVEAVRLLTTGMRYAVPPQDLAIRLSVIPARPASGMILTDVQAVEPTAGGGMFEATT